VRVLAPPPPPDLEVGSPPTFSVVIPAYQAAATVGEAVDSVLTQVPAPHEVIVVDDGSTDDTSAVLLARAGEVAVLQCPHRGPSASRNAGIGAATGDFVALLDADDVYEPGRLGAFTELATRRPDLDILATDALLEVDGEVVGTIFEHTGFPVEEQAAEILTRSFLVSPAIRRERLLAAGGFDESLRIGEDWDCWIRLLHGGARAGAVGEPLLRYRIGGPSLSADHVAGLRARLEILERAGRQALSAPERLAFRRAIPGYRRSALLAEAEQALVEGRPEARRLAMRVALSPDVGLATRFRGLGASVAPRVARRRLAHIEATTGQSYVRRPRPSRSVQSSPRPST
jgi:glycosyltransferase involved in cell wall biosynthesis